MITKFERKVIAGLTAFLMCLSMNICSSSFGKCRSRADTG